jgi:DNA-binding response OmpR family regulator
MIRVLPKGTVLTLLPAANGLVRFQLTRALEQAGYEVLWASTFEEAARSTERYHIDLLVLDLDRPLQDGCNVFERLSALNRAMPVVILTGHKTEFEPALTERLGALLEKPVDVPALIHTLSLLLGRPTQIQLSPHPGVELPQTVRPERRTRVARRCAPVNSQRPLGSEESSISKVQPVAA